MMLGGNAHFSKRRSHFKAVPQAAASWPYSVCRGPYFQTFFAVEHLEINAMQLQAIESKAEAFESFCRKTGSVDNIEIEDAADKLSECMNTLTEIGFILECDMYPGSDLVDVYKDMEKYRI